MKHYICTDIITGEGGTWCVVERTERKWEEDKDGRKGGGNDIRGAATYIVCRLSMHLHLCVFKL